WPAATVPTSSEAPSRSDGSAVVSSFRRNVLDRPDATVWIDDAFLSAPEADALFARLFDEIPWRQEHVVLFGRRVAMPRLSCWLGDPGKAYTYSGIRREPTPFTPTLDALRTRVGHAAG